MPVASGGDIVDSRWYCKIWALRCLQLSESHKPLFFINHLWMSIAPTTILKKYF